MSEKWLALPAGYVTSICVQAALARVFHEVSVSAFFGVLFAATLGVAALCGGLVVRLLWRSQGGLFMAMVLGLCLVLLHFLSQGPSAALAAPFTMVGVTLGAWLLGGFPPNSGGQVSEDGELDPSQTDSRHTRSASLPRARRVEVVR